MAYVTPASVYRPLQIDFDDNVREEEAVQARPLRYALAGKFKWLMLMTKTLGNLQMNVAFKPIHKQVILLFLTLCLK